MTRTDTAFRETSCVIFSSLTTSESSKINKHTLTITVNKYYRTTWRRLDRRDKKESEWTASKWTWCCRQMAKESWDWGNAKPLKYNSAHRQTLWLKTYSDDDTPLSQHLIIKTKTQITLCFLEPRIFFVGSYAKIKQTSFQLIERLSYFVLFPERLQCSFYIIAVLDSVHEAHTSSSFSCSKLPKSFHHPKLVSSYKYCSLAAAFLVDKDELCVNHIHTEPDVVNSQNHSSFALLHS